MLNDFLSPTMLWFISMLVILVAEMLLGTYYLLALAAGALIGGIVSIFFDTIDIQFTASAISTLVLLVLAFFYKKNARKKVDKTKINTNCIDAGAIITINALNQDGTASTFYRGATWSVKGYNCSLEINKNYIIKDIEGSYLIVLERA